MDAASSEIIIHPPSGWFFIFGHSPCLLAAPEGASTVWHVRGAFYFTFVQSPLPVTCLRLFYLFLLFLRFLCYSFLAYQTYFLFGRPPFDVLDAVARPHPYSTSKGVFLSCPTAISASEPPAPSAGFSLYKKEVCYQTSLNGGLEGDRTLDLTDANRTLSRRARYSGQRYVD